MTNNQEMYSLIQYFGIAVAGEESLPPTEYQDIEEFILKATTFNHTPRTLEGFLTWLNRYGYLISPSKIRRLVLKKTPHRSAFLGAICDQIERRHQVKFSIVRGLCESEKNNISITNTPIALLKSRNLIFENWGLIIADYECNEDKFLTPIKSLLQSCLELKNRIIMGSVVNSDICSLLAKNKKSHQLSLYEISQRTHHQRSSVSRALKIRFDEYLTAV